MAKKTRMVTDGATVRTKGQDLIVSPRRITMFLAAILIGLFGVMCLLGGGASAINALGEGDLEDVISSLALVLIGFGLLSVAYFAFNKGRSQKAVHFNVAQRQITVGQETIPFDRVSGVYLQHEANTTLGDISGTVLQTGIITKDTPIPIASVSSAKRDENMSNAITLIRLYAEYLGYDPKVVGRYEDLLKLDLSKGLPMIFKLESEES